VPRAGIADLVLEFGMKEDLLKQPLPRLRRHGWTSGSVRVLGEALASGFSISVETSLGPHLLEDAFGSLEPACEPQTQPTSKAASTITRSLRMAARSLSITCLLFAQQFNSWPCYLAISRKQRQDGIWAAKPSFTASLSRRLTAFKYSRERSESRRIRKL
jgi:hypothetical protein